LVVYPPASALVDRRLAWLYRGWSGAVLGLFAFLLLVDVVSSADAVLAVAVATYLGVRALPFVRAGPARVPVKSMSVLRMPGTTDVTELGSRGRSRTRRATPSGRLAAAGGVALFCRQTVAFASQTIHGIPRPPAPPEEISVVGVTIADASHPACAHRRAVVLDSGDSAVPSR
jgi:hypothetical protein